MKFPDDAIIARVKVTDYLLTRRIEDDKSNFLAQAGYTREHADRLQDDLRSLLELEAEFVQKTAYGDKYQICGTLTGPNGRPLRVTCIWMVEQATGKTKFVTLYPDKK